MRRIALPLLLLLWFAIPASAQSITSYAPDSTKKAMAPQTPPDAVDVPVWLGFQIAPIPGVTSKLQTQERTSSQNCTPWVGIGVTWPWARPWTTWVDAGYQHWEFAGTFRVDSLVSGGHIRVPIVDPIAMDQFTIRAGIDQWFWQQNRVSAAVGAGLGVGSGWVQAPSIAESNVLLTSEFVGRAFVYFKLNPRVRLGLGASGSVAYASGGSAVNGWWQHLEVMVRLEQAMRLPKRIVPGL